MRGIVLVAIGIQTLLVAASSEATMDRVSTGFLAQPAEGHYWTMAASYRASFNPQGIQLVRHGRRAAIRFPGAKLHWRAEGGLAGQVHVLGTESRSYTGAAAIRAREAFQGVDIVIRLRDGRLKSEFLLAPGVSPAMATYCMEGATIEADSAGKALRINAGGGWEFPLFLAITCVVQALLGGGKFAVDRRA